MVNFPENKDVLSQKIKSNILIYPVFLFLLLDFQYTELESYKSNKIIKQ